MTKTREMMDEREYLKKCPVTIFMVLVNVALFIICEFLGGSEDTGVLIRMGASVTERILDGEYYRLVTCMFLHIGIAHLINNMIVLIALGEYIEPVTGHVRYLILYLIGGTAGSILSVLCDIAENDTGTVSAGASGAVFALIGAYVVMVIRKRIRNQRLSLARLAFGIGLAILPGFYTPGVGVTAHLGGLIAGGVMGLFF